MDRIGLSLSVLGLGVTFAVSLPEAVEAQVTVLDASTWVRLTTTGAAIQPRSLTVQDAVGTYVPGSVALGAGFDGITHCIGSDDYRSLCRFLGLSVSALTHVTETAFGSLARGYGSPDLVRSSPLDMLVPLIASSWPCGDASHEALRGRCRYQAVVPPKTRLAAGLVGSFAGYLLSRVAEDELRSAQVGRMPGPGMR